MKAFIHMHLAYKLYYMNMIHPNEFPMIDTISLHEMLFGQVWLNILFEKDYINLFDSLPG